MEKEGFRTQILPKSYHSESHNHPDFTRRRAMPQSLFDFKN